MKAKSRHQSAVKKIFGAVLYNGNRRICLKITTNAFKLEPSLREQVVFATPIGSAGRSTYTGYPSHATTHNPGDQIPAPPPKFRRVNQGKRRQRLQTWCPLPTVVPSQGCAQRSTIMTDTRYMASAHLRPASSRRRRWTVIAKAVCANTHSFHALCSRPGSLINRRNHHSSVSELGR